MPKLRDLVRGNVQNYMYPDRAIDIYRLALLFQDKYLGKMAMTEIVMNTSEIVFKDSFQHAPLNVIQRIVNKPHLFIKPSRLRAALHSWAMNHAMHTDDEGFEDEIDALLGQIGQVERKWDASFACSYRKDLGSIQLESHGFGFVPDTTPW